MNQVMTVKPSQNSSSGLWSLIDAITLCLLVIAMCSQINLGDIGRDTTAEGYVTKQLKIALPDIALFVCFGWFLLRTTALRAWKKLWWPPLPCWALLATLLISILHSRPLINAIAESIAGAENTRELIKALLTKESKEAIAETIQFAGYFLIAPLLFVNLIHDARSGTLLSRRRLVLWTFFIALCGVTLLGCWQLLRGSDAPQSWFGSPYAWAAFCTIALPLLLARLLSAKVSTLPAIVLSCVAVALLAATMVSFWSLVCILIAMVAVGLWLRVPVRMATAMAITAVLLIGFWPRQANLQPARQQSFQLKSQQEKVKKQFVEWYVATTRLANRREASFATGAGPGNYQFNIGAYYSRLPNEEKMPPDSNNLFLVQAVNIGILGLGALLWMVLHFGQLACKARENFKDDWLAAGVLGSMTAWLLVNLFHATIVRGTGIVFAFVLALAVIALHRDREPQPEEKGNSLADWMS
jgi:hypothetical protein